MEKLMYLMECGACTDKAAASQRMLEQAHALARRGAHVGINVWEPDPGVRQRAVHYATQDGPHQLLAVLSVWLDSLDDRSWIDQAVDRLNQPWHAYLVTESVPRTYSRRDWSVGTKSPGVTLVAAFCKPEELPDEEFYRRWHQGHTPLSLQVHPLFRYVRNAVVRPLSQGSPLFRAIVEERVRCLDDLHPEIFYGGQAERVTQDLAGFVDLSKPGQIRIELMSEYLFYS